VPAQAEAVRMLAHAHGFPQDATAETAFRQSMSDHLAVGSAKIRPSRLALHAALDREQPEAGLAVLAPEAGLAVLAEALRIVDTPEDCWWEAERYRRTGAASSRPASPGMRPMW
jgi:hypothetical protein